MTERECIETFEELRKILEEQGLRWLVEAVTREIQEGLIEIASEKDVMAEGIEPSRFRLTPEYRRSLRKEEFLVRREFSQTDRLQLLVDAVEEVVTQADGMEHELAQFFEESRGPKEFQFGDKQSPTVIVKTSRVESSRRPAAVRKLRELLQELKQEIVR
jgi:hypothetical protein